MWCPSAKIILQKTLRTSFCFWRKQCLCGCLSSSALTAGLLCFWARTFRRSCCLSTLCLLRTDWTSDCLSCLICCSSANSRSLQLHFALRLPDVCLQTEIRQNVWRRAWSSNCKFKLSSKALFQATISFRNTYRFKFANKKTNPFKNARTVLGLQTIEIDRKTNLSIRNLSKVSQLKTEIYFFTEQ